MSSKKTARRRHRRQMLALVLLCLSAALLFSLSLLFRGGDKPVNGGLPASAKSEPQPASTPLPTPTPEPEPIVTTLSFSATGDNLIHDVLFNQAARRATAAGKSGYDFGALYANVANFYKDYDINWLNQETLVNDEYAPSNYPCFSSPGDLGRHMYDLGFRVFSLSNNHTYDKGAGGIDATRAFWASMPDDCYTTGIVEQNDADSAITIQEKDGVTIAYLAYTEHTNGIPTPSAANAHVIYTSQTDVMQKQITRARELADFVVVSMHWGWEDNHTTNDAQRALAQDVVDWGADVIIGTHPHVVQDMEWYTAADGRQALVSYSLGNFVSGQSSADNLLGIVMTFDLVKTTMPDGAVITAVMDPKAWPIVTHYGWGHSEETCYFFSDYTPELAAAHGVKKYSPHFSYDYAKSVFVNNVSAEFLQMD